MSGMRPEVIEIRLDNPDKVSEVKAVNGIVVLSVSGSEVTSRQIGDNDPFMSRLKMSGSLMGLNTMTMFVTFLLLPWNR